MTTTKKWGQEITVNTNAVDDQSGASIAALANGRFVVTWTDDSASSGSAVHAQMFFADGSKDQSEFQFTSSSELGVQFEPSIVALTNGRFMAVWTDVLWGTGISPSRQTQAQMFNADGAPIGSAFAINTPSGSDPERTHQSSDPQIQTLSDQTLISVWTDWSTTGPDASGGSVRAQLFNVSGEKIGSEILVNTTTIYDQFSPTVATLADGGFVIAWANSTALEITATASSSLVRAQMFDATGAPRGAELQINTTLTSFQGQPTLIGLANGGFLAAWTGGSEGVEGSGSNIRAQIFDATGEKVGTEFMVNATASGYHESPSVTTLSGGTFVVAWSSYAPDGFTSVQAQAFDANGSKVGSEFMLTNNSDETKFDPQMATLADGRFALTWTELLSQTGADTDGLSVHLQIFDPRESAVVLQGSNFADDFVGTRWNDEMHGGRGQDSLKGHGGNDLLVGEVGNDTLDGGFGIDTLVGGRGNDTYYVDRENEQVVELAGEGIDTVISAWANLSLANFLNVENAQVTGQRNFSVTGNDGKNSLIGNRGVNLMEGLGGNDAMFGRLGSDTLYGGNGNDSLEGGNGIDSLFGGAGRDTLVGGAGRDHLSGGTGADVFVFHTKYEAGNLANRDVIADFTVGQDKIDLSAIDAQETLAGDQAFSFIGNSAFSGVAGELRYNAGNGIVYADTNGDGIADFQLQLIGKPAITAGDFVL